MSKIILIFWGCLLTLSACSSSGKHDAKKTYQTISALGDTLHAYHLDTKHADMLAKFKKDYKNDTGDSAALISYGQKLAEFGNHTESAAIFSKGIDQLKNNPRLYLYRGQQYLALRKFDEAVRDFRSGIDMVNNKKDETDNKDQKKSPITQLQYQLGVTYYLQGNYEQSQDALEECLNNIQSSEMGVAASYWLYMSLRRIGKDEMAGEILKPIAEDMGIHKNKAYHQLLMVFKGVFKADMLSEEFEKSDSLESPTIGYGLGNWHYINGRKQRAQHIFRKVYESSQWDSSGYIAAEEDLAKLFDN